MSTFQPEKNVLKGLQIIIAGTSPLHRSKTAKFDIQYECLRLD